MLNIGFTEILCFSIISLLILGPEKLPEAARFVAKWYGKFKKFISNVQNQIDQELHLAEFRQEIQKEIDRLTEFELRMQKQMDQVSTQAKQTITLSNHSNIQQPLDVYPDLKQFNFQFLDQPFSIPFTQHHTQQQIKNMMKHQQLTHSHELRIAV